MAAALCHRDNLRPRDLIDRAKMHELQEQLLRSGQHIPGVDADGCGDKVRTAKILATSTLELSELRSCGEFMPLNEPVALLLPIAAGAVPTVTVTLIGRGEVTVLAELWGGRREGNTTPDVKLGEISLSLHQGAQQAHLGFDSTLKNPAHLFYMLHPAEGVQIAVSEDQVTGVLTLAQKMNKAVAKSPVQTPPQGSGIDSFAFWLPDRRPLARNLAATITPPLKMFNPSNIVNGVTRPWCGVNAWIPAREDSRPTLLLEWAELQAIREIEISFDTDFDHPMESVLMGHPERVMPACVTKFEVCAGAAGSVAHVVDNHQTRWKLLLDAPLETKELSVAVLEHGPALPAIFEVRCY
jgi:hypothetical protein